MKHCPQCNKQFTDAWVTFCSEDGTVLVDSGLSPSGDPNWDPRIRGPQVESPSEQATQWLPRQPPNQAAWVPPDERGWVAPDERQPMRAPVWKPPPPPHVKPQSQGLAIASMITGIIGLLVGGFCLGPIPGIAALVLGLVALSQIKKAPDRNGGKPFAIVGVITGGLSVLFYGALILFWLIAIIFRS